MEQITQHVESQFNGQKSTAAHACLLAANIQASIEGLGFGRDDAYVLDTFPSFALISRPLWAHCLRLIWGLITQVRCLK